MGKWFLELFTHTRLIFSVFSPAERRLMGGQGFNLFLDGKFLCFKIDLHLQIDEVFITCAKVVRQPQGCIHRDLSAILEDFLNSAYRYIYILCQFVRTQIEG
jgi:hypothetical protein